MTATYPKDSPKGTTDVRNMTVIACMAIGRQLENRKPTVVEVSRYAERAFRVYLGAAGSEGPFNDEQRDLINEVALALLKHFDVVPQ